MQIQRIRELTLLIAAMVMTGHSAAGAERSDDHGDVARVIAKNFQAAVRAYDTDKWASMMAEDVVMMAPGGRLLQGRRTFRDFWARAFEGRSGPNPLAIRIDDVRASGDLIAIRAHYGPEGEDPVGQYVWLVSRGDNDEWRIDWWMFSRMTPPPDRQ